MKVSHTWLGQYFNEPVSVEKIDEAFTFHAFEIDEIKDDYIDVKVLPSRGADCLCHRGLAKELSVILGIPLTKDSLRESLPEFPETNSLKVTVDDSTKCVRYSGAVLRGVRVEASPAWLKEAIESVGQRSINNVVDATNYVMLNIGQPLHAFDAKKLTEKDGAYAIGVRNAKEGEKITTLSNEEYTLDSSTLLITDAHADYGIGIAGIKGGKVAEVTSDTTDIIVEAANFDGTHIRRSAQKLKLFTDASMRFQNRPSPELVSYAMRGVLNLIAEIAGGTVEGVVDIYPQKPTVTPVSVTLSHVNSLLGSTFTLEEVRDVFARLDLSPTVEGETFTVTPPFERTDVTIPEDLIEEVGRILGYDRVIAVDLPPIEGQPDQARYHGIERMKDALVAEGYIEVSTQSFAKKGEITLANPLDKTKPALRTSLEENLTEAIALSKHNGPLVLQPNQKPKLFEVGTVFTKEGEHVELRMTERVPAWGDTPTVDNLSEANLEEYGKDYTPVSYRLGMYKPFSAYPFITRDIALWAPETVLGSDVEARIKETAGSLCTRITQFDEFKKDGRVSYAFRLVFQSYEKTLTDEEITPIMESITSIVTKEGWEVR